jgi:hypothetical protein
MAAPGGAVCKGGADGADGAGGVMGWPIESMVGGKTRIAESGGKTL